MGIVNTMVIVYRMTHTGAIHLKLGFQAPEGAAVGRRDLRRRRSESRKKPTLTAPRMTTPEISALVSGFIGREELPPGAG